MRRSARTILNGIRTHGHSLAVAGLFGVVGVTGVARMTGGDAPDAPTEAQAEAMEVAAAEAVAAAAPAWDLPNLDHSRVDYWVARFDTVPDMREKFEGFLVRSGWFHDMISAKLAERGMPQDLVYLAMIESGFQPKAYSHAAASGIWQFISETGRRYGLQIDGHVDERNHPEKATDAALDYLEELHERFDSWYLAAAAYNSGENRVGRIMREQFGTEKARSEADYYRIWDRLPRETRDYVPLMIAAAHIAKDPAAHGFPELNFQQPLRFDVVSVPGGTPLPDVARAAGVPLEDVLEESDLEKPAAGGAEDLPAVGVDTERLEFPRAAPTLHADVLQPPAPVPARQPRQVAGVAPLDVAPRQVHRKPHVGTRCGKLGPH
ncbi:MAG: transglycosylase SLT domain-containing protein, partial [Gemmatimonadetes bacterium]|nr:transglycosylase SLT domain-containing protein [Gemmatimonadota bacterium]